MVRFRIMDHLTFQQLREQYTEDELSYFPGDMQLRYKIFAPFFQQLFENKLVYYERFIVIVQLQDIKITPTHFSAKANLLLSIRPIKPPYKVLDEPWNFGGKWDWMRLISNSLQYAICRLDSLARAGSRQNGRTGHIEE